MGWTQERIAAALGVSQRGVSGILRRCCRKKVAALNDEVLRWKLEQNERLDYLIDQAGQAWEKSKLDAQKAVKATGKGRKTTTLMSAGRCGDVAYLDEMRAAMDAQRKLWGL